MKLTRRSDFALRALIYLAERGENGRVAIAELSREIDVSAHHLYKIVQSLSRAGYLSTLPGRDGGVRLERSPEEITLREVISHVEGPIQFTECMSNPGDCVLFARCRLRGKIAEAQEAMLGVLEEATIEDLLAGDCPEA